MMLKWNLFKRSLILLLWKKVLFLSKNADFVQKMLTPAKFRELLIYKLYFVKLNMCLHLRIESQVSSVIPLQNKLLKMPSRLGLI